MTIGEKPPLPAPKLTFQSPSPEAGCIWPDASSAELDRELEFALIGGMPDMKEPSMMSFGQD